MTPNRDHRSGITLMEVLIAVGILAIGLSSVVSLLQAGHSMAQRSFVTDKAAIIAANAAADFVTQGLLRPECLTASTPPLLIDPFGAGWPGGLSAVLKQDGVFALSTSANARVLPVSGYLVRGRDDVIFNIPDNPTFDVTNRFSTDGIREYQGKFSWAAMLARPSTSTTTGFLPGENAALSIIVFHQRDPTQSPVPVGAYTAGSGSVVFPNTGVPLIPGRQNRDILRTGGVMLLVPAGGSPAVRRLALASMTTDQSGKETGAFIEFEGGDPLGGPFTAFLIPDAVAVLQRMVTIEGPNGYVP